MTDLLKVDPKNLLSRLVISSIMMPSPDVCNLGVIREFIPSSNHMNSILFHLRMSLDSAHYFPKKKHSHFHLFPSVRCDGILSRAANEVLSRIPHTHQTFAAHPPHPPTRVHPQITLKPSSWSLQSPQHLLQSSSSPEASFWTLYSANRGLLPPAPPLELIPCRNQLSFTRSDWLLPIIPLPAIRDCSTVSFFVLGSRSCCCIICLLLFCLFILVS